MASKKSEVQSASGKHNWLPTRHQRPVNDVSFSVDGRRIATASDDRSIGIWMVSQNGELTFMERLEGHGARVNAAGFLDPFGRRVMSASSDGLCRIVNPPGMLSSTSPGETICTFRNASLANV